MQHWKYKALRRTALVLLLTALCVSWLDDMGGTYGSYGLDRGEAFAAVEAPAPASVQKLVRGHWSEDPEIMKKNHPALLREGMENGTRATTRKEDATIERCVTCHIVRNEQGNPLGAADPRHFCRSCHSTQRVSINCFTCHASLPMTDPAIMDVTVRNADSLKARLQEWQKHQQGGAK